MNAMALMARRDSAFVSLLMGLTLSLVVCQAANSLSVGGGAEGEAPDTSCVGCHSSGVPEGTPPGQGEAGRSLVRLIHRSMLSGVLR